MIFESELVILAVLCDSLFSGKGLWGHHALCSPTHTHTHTSHCNFWTIWPIYMKIGMNFMPWRPYEHHIY